MAVNGAKVVGCSLSNLRVAVTHPVNGYMEIGVVAPHPASDG